MLWQLETWVPLEGSQRDFMDAGVRPNSKLSTDGIALGAPTLVYFPSSYPLIWHLAPSTYGKRRGLVISLSEHISLVHHRKSHCYGNVAI